jgi:hypothetical protein
MTAKHRLDGLMRDEKPVKPVVYAGAGYLVQYQKELILLLFCG